MKNMIMNLLSVLTLLILGAQGENPDPNRWELVFEDNFGSVGDKSKTKPNSSMWNVLTGFSVGSKEKAYWTDRLDNVYQSEGTLKIKAISEDYPIPGGGSAPYTSGGIQSRLPFKYGRFEAGIKLPAGVGPHPAFWMLANDTRMPTPWPICGEIDIMENVGYTPNTVYSTLHDGANNWELGNDIQNRVNLSCKCMYTSFVNYTLVWTPTKLSMYANGFRVLTHDNPMTCQQETWPYHTPFVLKLQQNIGGNWGGRDGIDKSIFPIDFEVDYVRVYQNAADSSGYAGCTNTPFTLEIEMDGLDTEAFYNAAVVDGPTVIKLHNSTQQDLVALIAKRNPSISKSSRITVQTVAPLVIGLKSLLGIQFTIVDAPATVHFGSLSQNVSASLPKLSAHLAMLPGHRGNSSFHNFTRGHSATLEALGGGFPYKAVQVPHDTIYAGQFDHGGQLVGSLDSTPWNLYGNKGGRAAPSYVDLDQVYPGAPKSQMAVGYIVSGEWLMFSGLNVSLTPRFNETHLPTHGNFTVDFTYANGMNDDGTIELEINGVDSSFQWSLNPTVNWNIFDTVKGDPKKLIQLKAGWNTIKLKFVNGNSMLQSFKLTEYSGNHAKRPGGGNNGQPHSTHVPTYVFGLVGAGAAILIGVFLYVKLVLLPRREAGRERETSAGTLYGTLYGQEGEESVRAASLPGPDNQGLNATKAV